MYAKGFLVIVLGGIIAYCLDESYRLFNSEHRAFSEKSIYFDPYGPHYWPPSNEFYDAQGNKITYEEGLKAYNELHDFVFDKEGNVLEIYEKGKGPKSAAGQSRSLDSPYYIFNMTEDEKSAYYSAVGYIEGKSISKNELLQILSESYSTDIAKFAVKAAEENEKVDWIEECRQATDLVMKWDVSREEAMDALTGEFGRGFTVEEAEMVLNEYSF